MAAADSAQLFYAHRAETFRRVVPRMGPLVTGRWPSFGKSRILWSCIFSSFSAFFRPLEKTGQIMAAIPAALDIQN